MGNCLNKEDGVTVWIRRVGGWVIGGIRRVDGRLVG